MRRLLITLALLGAALSAFAQTPPQPFQPTGPTVTFTANVAASIPTPVQALSTNTTLTQYIVTNTGSVVVFVAYGTTSALTTTNCAVPGATYTVPIQPLAAFVISLGPNYYFCGVTSAGTAAVYITPGLGN